MMDSINLKYVCIDCGGEFSILIPHGVDPPIHPECVICRSGHTCRDREIIREMTSIQPADVIGMTTASIISRTLMMGREAGHSQGLHDEFMRNFMMRNMSRDRRGRLELLETLIASRGDLLSGDLDIFGRYYDYEGEWEEFEEWSDGQREN